MKVILPGIIIFSALTAMINANGKAPSQIPIPSIFYDVNKLPNTAQVPNLPIEPVNVLPIINTIKKTAKDTGMQTFHEMKEKVPLLWQNKDRRHLVFSHLPCEQLHALLQQNVMFGYLIPQSSIPSFYIQHCHIQI